MSLIDKDKFILHKFSKEAPTSIFVDVSNIYPKIRSVKIKLRYFVDFISRGHTLEQRIAFGSKTSIEKSDWETEFENEGYLTRSCIVPENNPEEMVDDCISAHILREIVAKNTFGKPVQLIVVSGDGNQRNGTNVSIFDSIQMALLNGIRVKIMGWRGIVNLAYQSFLMRFPELFNLVLLDELIEEKTSMIGILKSPPRQFKIEEVVEKQKTGKRTFKYQIILKDLDDKPFKEMKEMENRNHFNTNFSLNVKWASMSPLPKSPCVIFLYFDNEEAFNKALEIKDTFKTLPIHGEIRNIRTSFKIDPLCESKENQKEISKENSKFKIMKIIAKNEQKFQDKNVDENTEFFKKLFQMDKLSISKTPKKTPNILYAYFETEEELNNCFEIAKKHPIIFIDGNLIELEYLTTTYNL